MVDTVMEEAGAVASDPGDKDVDMDIQPLQALTMAKELEEAQAEVQAATKEREEAEAEAAKAAEGSIISPERVASPSAASDKSLAFESSNSPTKSMLEEEEESLLPMTPLATRDGADDTQASALELRDVHFSYPSRPEIPVLCGLDLIVERNQFVALVGTSGSGKSTILSIVEQFYEPQTGQVMLDGRPLRSTGDDYAFRDGIALVAQDNVLFNESIRFNIALGARSGHEPSQLEIEAAAVPGSNWKAWTGKH